MKAIVQNLKRQGYKPICWPAWQAFEREGEENSGKRPCTREKGGGDFLTCITNVTFILHNKTFFH